MKINTIISAMAATASVLGISAGAANAGTVGSFQATQSSPLVTFTGGAGGVLSVPNSSSGGITAFASSPVAPYTSGISGTVFTFGPISVTGPAVTAGSTTTEALGGGSFAIKNSAGTITYLSGTFTASTLGGNLPTTSASELSFGANSVTYTGGLFLTNAGFDVGDTGTFSLAMSGLIPGLVVGSGSPAYFSNFTAGSSTVPGGLTGTFDVTGSAVPEPASVIPFALGGLGLLGLIARKTRRTSGAAA